MSGEEDIALLDLAKHLSAEDLQAMDLETLREQCLKQIKKLILEQLTPRLDRYDSNHLWLNIAKSRLMAIDELIKRRDEQTKKKDV